MKVYTVSIYGNMFAICTEEGIAKAFAEQMAKDETGGDDQYYIDNGYEGGAKEHIAYLLDSIEIEERKLDKEF